MRHCLTFVLLLFASVTFCQNITLKGNVQDDQSLPLESATVYLSTVKDSSVVDYTITDSKGNWELKTKQISQPVFFRVSFVGFREHKQQLELVTEDKDFGTIKLEASVELDELIIVRDIPPIRIKQDTLEFNASSFKVRPDANVEALLMQLPGFVKDADGKITINGKDVNRILVNGKPFFDETGQIALQNLPADIINKVQVTDTKTKKEELAGEKATSNTSTINLTIQDDKNKGFFGKVMGGYGSDDRYEGSLLVNYFKNKRRISILGSSNNINSLGFSMNEVFDNMGGGRNIGTFMSSSGASWGNNGIMFGGQGITTSNMIGITYADEWSKNVEGNGSYFFNTSNSENDNRTRQVTFLPQAEGTITNNNFTTESTSNSESEQFGHNFSSEFETKLDSTSTLNIRPKFTASNSKSKADSQEVSYNQNNELLNESSGFTFNESDNRSFSNDIEFHKSFKRKRRFLSASLNQRNRNDDGVNFNNSTTIFYEDIDGDGIAENNIDARDQIRNNKQRNDSYRAQLEYNEPVLDSLLLKIAASYSYDNNINDRVGYDYDAVTGDYTALNPLLTNYLESQTNTLNPSVGFVWEQKKLNISGDFGTNISTFDIYSLYLGNDYSLKRDYLLPTARMNIRYKIGKSAHLFGNYNYFTNFPSPMQVLPVVDVTNPLYTVTGNPDLDPNKSHSFYLNFRNYNFASRSGYGFNINATIYDSQIVNFTLIDESAKRTTTYRNISGAYNIGIGGNWSKSFKKDAHNYRISFNMNSTYGLNRGYTNGQLYESRSLRVGPSVNFSYDYGELLTINPTYNFSYNESNYTNYSISGASNFVHTFNLQTTSYWPKHIVFGNDFGYTYNSNIDDGFKKDFYLWNTSLGYNFFKDKMLFKVKVYDVLNQNIGTSRTITETTIRDVENTVLRRYVMFSLTIKLQKFGGKESSSRNRFQM